MDRGRLTIKLDGLISFQCADGFLSASGIEGERLHLQSPPIAETGDEALPFFSFSRNVFRIVQTRSQAIAAEELKSGKGASSQAHGDEDAAAAEAAANGSSKANKNSEGEGDTVKTIDVIGTQEITYGQVFSLMHVDSGLYVSVAHSQPSRNDPDCVSVILVNEDGARSSSCEFMFVSRYKIHSDGDKLCRADEVLIRLAAKPVFLHVSAPPFMEETDEAKEEEQEVLNRNFRLGANLTFQRLPAAGRSTQAFVSPSPSEQASRNPSFALSKEALQAAHGGSPSAAPETREEAIQGLTRDYLDEVNGCEEGGVSFIVNRYDVGTDRANTQRNQLHISRSYVACGTPLCFYHREREAFLTTSVTNPRKVQSNEVKDTEGGGVTKTALKQRRFQGEMSGVQALTGAEGRIHGSSTSYGDTTDAAATVTPTADARMETTSMQSRAERAACAAARATSTVGLVDVSATRRLPFPVFADIPAETAGSVEVSLGDKRCGPTSLWIIEAEDPMQGGPVRVDQGDYRIKHVITGLYLAVCGTAVDDFFEDDVDSASDGHIVDGSDHDDHDADEHAEGNNNNNNNNNKDIAREGALSVFSAAATRPVRETQLCLIPEPRTHKDMQRSLFSVENMFATECHWLIEQDCLVLKNALTGMYLSTDNALDGPNIRLELQWQPSVADTIVATYAQPDIQKVSMFIYHQCQTLAKFREAFQAAAKDKQQYRDMRREQAAAGDATAQAEVESWERERRNWEAAAQERMHGEDIDEELLKQHRMENTSQSVRDERAWGSTPGSVALGASMRSGSWGGGNGRPGKATVGRDYAALLPLIRRTQDTLISLIRFCQESTEMNVLKAEGLPISAHQRALFDAHVYRLIFDVILTPFCKLETDPTMGGTAAGLPLRGDDALRDRNVYQAVLSASQQRQVPMYSLWDLTSHLSPPQLAEERRKRLPQTPLSGGVMEVTEVMLPTHAEIHLTCRLAFQLLKLMVAQNSALAEGWSVYITHCLALDGRRLHVVETLKAMFTDNVNLPLASVKAVAEHFIGATGEVRRASYLDFLGAACTFKFKGIAPRQDFIAQKLLVEHPELLAEFVLVDGDVCVVVEPGAAPVPMDTFFTSYPDQKQVKFVENQIALMAKLCYDGSSQFCRDEVAKKIHEDMVLHILKRYVWTGNERVGVASKMDVLRSHWVRLAFQCFVVEKIRDPERQLRRRTVLFGSSELRKKKDPEYYSGERDDEMTATLKEVTLNILKANPYFVQDDVGRSVLMRAVIAVWFRIVRFRQYTLAEIHAAVPLLLGLLDGTQDVLSTNPVVIAQQTQSRRDALEAAGRIHRKKAVGGAAAAASGGGGVAGNAKMSSDRLEIKKESVHLMRIREMVCQCLTAALDNAMFTAADEVIVYLYNVYTNPEAYRNAPKPWRQGDEGGGVKGLLSYGSAGLQAVGVKVLAAPGEATALISKEHEAGCCCGCSSKRKGKKAKIRADGYEEVGSGSDAGGDLEDGESNGSSGGESVHAHGEQEDSLSDNSDDDEHEVFEQAKKIARKSDTTLVTATDIRDYLDFLTARICRHFVPGKLVPLLLDVTRYNSDALTTQAMRLLVQLCVVRRSMAQMILTVNTLPSREVVKSFDKIHDVAVTLRKSMAKLPNFADGWSQAIKIAVGTLLDTFEDDAAGPTEEELPAKATAEELQKARDAIARVESAGGFSQEKTPTPESSRASASAPKSPDRESDLRNIYSSFALAAKERRMFGGGSVDSLAKDTARGSSRGSRSGSVVSGETPRTRAQKLWAKTAGATRMLIYNNTIRSRRQALGLSDTSRVPMNLVVRAEMMAHWRIHETLLAMVPKVPPEDPCFFRLMKFFYFFTLSRSNAKLLRSSSKLFIDAIPKSEKTRALCLNITVAILGNMHNVNEYLTPELLSAFVHRIDNEVYTKIPDKEFVQLLSDKIFSKPTVSVVARRRMMLTLREHNTLACLSKPRLNPTVVEVDFVSTLVNLVCNICGNAISVLTLAQRMLTSASICRIVMQRLADNPLGVPLESVTLHSQASGTPAERSLSLKDVSAHREGSGFKLVDPYLRALVALYFTTPEDNAEDRRQRQANWMSSRVWWDTVRVVSALYSTCAAHIAEDQGQVENAGLETVETNRQYFLTTVPIAMTAFFANCYNREGYTKNQPKIIKSAFEDLINACAKFADQIMHNINGLDLTVGEVVNFRRLLGILEFIGSRSGYAAMRKPCEHCATVKDQMLTWLAAEQTKLHARLMVEAEQRKQLGISHTNEEDEGAFDILFREEAVSNQLQSGIESGHGLLMSGLSESHHQGVSHVRTALRAMLKGNSLVPSLKRHSSEVVLIVNALLIQSTYSASVRESLKRILAAMQKHLLTPRTFVGLLNLFYNSLDSVLHRFNDTTSIDKVLKAHPPFDLVDEHEAPRMATEWELAQAAESNANASIPEDSLAYGLQIVYNSLGMMNVVVTLCGIDDEVVTYSAVRLGVAILEGGNERVQNSLLNYFTTREEGFFHNVRDILRGSMGYVERVNAEHQYYMLKRGLRSDMRVGTASTNMQLVEGLKPARDGGSHRSVLGKDSAFLKLSGWGRARGGRRIRLVVHLFRLLQLFCEGHQNGMQNYIRSQHDNLHSANMVHEAATLLAELSVYITPANLKVVTQGFDLLTEVCQGPCRANQESLINYDACWTISHCLAYVNGPQIFIGDPEDDRINNISEADVGELRTAVSNTALALIEGCREEEMYQKMLTQLPLQDIEIEISSVRPSLLYKITNDERYEHHPCAEALYNWLIYLKSVQPYANDLQLKQINEILRRTSMLSQYLGSIEINREDGLERVYFRIPQICTSLTQARKDVLLWDVDRTSRATKLADFLHKADEVIFAVEQQHQFVSKVKRFTRFTVSYDPEAPALSRGWQQVKDGFNRYVAPLIFSYEVAYYEVISMILAIIVNVILVIFEGVRMRSRLGTLIMQQEVRLVSILCLVQTFVCLALCYMDVVVTYPVHLYEMYKENQRLISGKAKFDISIDEVRAGLTRREKVECFMGWFGAQFRIFLFVMAALSWLVSPYFAAFNLMLLIYKISTLRTFITAITANGKQLLLTALLGVILLYLFSIVGFLLFSGQYDPDAEEFDDTNCQTLSRCFLYIVNQGLRAGGGVGDVMRPWTWTDPDVGARMTYDMLFYALITVVFLNILFGIIIDTFGQMRDEKNEKEEDMHGFCFICGLDHDTLEKTGVSGFLNHVKTEHNMWMYLYFMHHLRRKDPTDFTGQESYVNEKIQLNSLAFFPEENCLSLMALGDARGDGDGGDSDSDNDDEGAATGGGGKGKESANSAADLLRDLSTTKEGLNTYLKEISADSARLKAVLQQLELGARSSYGDSRATAPTLAFGGGGGNGGGASAAFSKARTMAPGQSRLPGSGATGSDRGSAQRSRTSGSATGGGDAARPSPTSQDAATASQVRYLEQQLRQLKEERAKLKEERSRINSSGQRKDAELQHLREELAKYTDSKGAKPEDGGPSSSSS